jgi:hypothetical protein
MNKEITIKFEISKSVEDSILSIINSVNSNNRHLRMFETAQSPGEEIQKAFGINLCNIATTIINKED